jgi:hypothetical protein
MNYSSLDEIYDDFNYSSIDNKKLQIEEFTTDKLLNDYNKLTINLKTNLNTIRDLEKIKSEVIKYKTNIFSAHQDIMIKLYRTNDDINELNDIIIKYIELFKKYFDNWINEYHSIEKEKLEKEISEQEEELASFRKLFINTTKEIIKTEKNNKNICPICFENEINMCAVPCGHTCCDDCIVQSIRYHNMRVNKCLCCRNTISDYIKMYIQL